MPRPNRIDEDAELLAMVAAAGIGTIFSAAEGPAATTVPIIWRDDEIIVHLAIANAHWRSLDGTEVLVVVLGPDAYISPSWYPAKFEHGRVVPTWNYSSVHLHGRATVQRDPQWTRQAVTDLTDLHEADRAEPWAVADAPAEFLDSQLRAIVGIRIAVEHVQGKAKWSQNRPAADQDGVAAGLAALGTPAAADAAAELLRFRRGAGS